MRENLEIIFKLPLKLKGFMPIVFLWMIEYDQRGMEHVAIFKCTVTHFFYNSLANYKGFFCALYF